MAKTREVLVTKYLLDTNIVSEMRKPRPHGAVIAWIKALGDEQIYLSAVTLGELQVGIEQTMRQDPDKAVELQAWAHELGDSYRILPMDAACFREWGRLISGKSDHLSQDAMIAATARVHNLVVATRNEKDFRSFSVQIFNPFQAT
jgi:predicted nucleic acid-binding protein